MQIEVTIRHESVAGDVREYAEKKAQRLLKYYDRTQAIRVILDHGGGGFTCEMLVDLEHMHDLVAHTAAPTVNEAIDLAVDRLERQLIEHKDRTRNRKGRGPNPHQPTRT